MYSITVPHYFATGKYFLLGKPRKTIWSFNQTEMLVFLHSSSILISVGIVSVLMGSDEVPWSERGKEIESNTAHHGDTLPTLHITHRSSLVSLQHSIASQSQTLRAIFVRLGTVRAEAEGRK